MHFFVYFLLGSTQHAITSNIKLPGLNLASVSKRCICEEGGVFFEFWGLILPTKMIICLLQPWFFAIINAGCVFQGYKCYQVGLELMSMKSCAAFSTVAAWPTSWPLTEHHLADVSHVELCVTLAVVWWQMQKGSEKAKWKIPNEDCCWEIEVVALAPALVVCGERWSVLAMLCPSTALYALKKCIFYGCSAYCQFELLSENMFKLSCCAGITFLSLCAFPVLLLFSPGKFHSCGLSPSRYLAVPSQMLTSLKRLVVRTSHAP